MPQKIDVINFPTRRFSPEREQSFSRTHVQSIGHANHCGSNEEWNVPCYLIRIYHIHETLCASSARERLHHIDIALFGQWYLQVLTVVNHLVIDENRNVLANGSLIVQDIAARPADCDRKRSLTLHAVFSASTDSAGHSICWASCAVEFNSWHGQSLLQSLHFEFCILASSVDQTIGVGQR